ncbi:MAG: HAD family hydrolase [Planctomycetes bacterium]|nr:HAD family hydrolase [Planctomycetota bacterium]MBL7107173.1 HAD family hydrolase [Phycisphaerae bacterium]
MKFKAAIFDLDGTLLDTLDDLANSMNYALCEMGFASHPVEAYKYFVGDGLKTETTRALPPDNRGEQTVEKCMKIAREHYSQHWADNTRAYPGIAEMLGFLQDKKIPLAVLSNKPDDFTQLTVGKLLCDFAFEVVQGVSEKVKKKPDICGALAIIEKIGVQPNEVLYLGDTDTDMKTAVSAGMFAVGALWGFRKADELLKNGAKVIVETPRQVIELFKENC